SRSRRPINPLFQGAYAFERVENTRLAWYARNFLVGPRAPQPEVVPTPLQKDLELIKLRLMECRSPREHDLWLHSALRVAAAMNPYLAPDDAAVVWTEIAAGRCFASLQEFQRRWIALFRAVALRDAGEPHHREDPCYEVLIALREVAVENQVRQAVHQRPRGRGGRSGVTTVAGKRRLQTIKGAGSRGAQFGVFVERDLAAEHESKALRMREREAHVRVSHLAAASFL